MKFGYAIPQLALGIVDSFFVIARSDDSSIDAIHKSNQKWIASSAHASSQ
ncbi:MAG: hypothetical protein LBH67_01775 [Rickettsia sp.]|jgi:hypothetical protein|nr:hypothetical protein [Rickettsia sp.]